jgi:hypothetical protein
MNMPKQQKHLESYLKIIEKSSAGAVRSIKETVDKVVPEYIEPFSHQEHIKGLLLGQVQSGKTGQMLGIVAAAADADDGFSVFVLLTSDISALQQQTYKRALASMDTFNVCDEHDEMRFLEIGTRKPSLIILKKNTQILKKWRNILSSSGACTGRPIFVVDDEADAASLNTLVNKKEQSTINTHLQAMLNLSTSSFYLQVTATPQSLVLQAEDSEWKPTFVHYFPPGKGYLGGDFFYSKPRPYTNRTTDDNELSLLIEDGEIAEGLKRAIETYLITCAQLAIGENSDVCNFLIHPSIRINHHDKIRAKVLAYTEHVFDNLNESDIQKRLRNAWTDLQTSKPHIKSYADINAFLESRPSIKVVALNSGPQGDSAHTFDTGLNIVIGGNSLGRGVTFKGLQTVYYCRESKSPQADTFWQHCRMFGYDRDPLLMRVFMPEALFNMFSEINASNEVLIKEIEEGRFDQLQIITTGKIKPTRKNVVDQSKYSIIVGGVNYFPPSQEQENAKVLDSILENFDNTGLHDIRIDDAIGIIENLNSDLSNNWSIPAYASALHSIKSGKDAPDLVKLIVRRDRDIKRGTGTLLSPNDRALGEDFPNITVITLYRLKGQEEKGWKGSPFWIPNIKLPKGNIFHRAD